jgi:maltooligosyltrehalose trehalohydrolase
MTQEAGGWFRGPAVDWGGDYSFSIDGGPPRPDPRSRWQPGGVDGPSRWVTHLPPPALREGPVPLRQALIYELHVGTFSPSGTFSGAIPYLGHLVDLGVTHVELMPIAQFPGVHGWGYDVVGLYAPHAGYGGPAALRELIEACHEVGLAVIVDVVHNHFGPEGDYSREFGPYKTDRYRTPWGSAINLDADGSREVRSFLIGSALTWLRDYGCDGLRLDALHSLCDRSELHFVAELVDEIRKLERSFGRSLVVIGEYDEHDPRAVAQRPRGWGLDAHWNDDFHHAVHALLTGETCGYYRDFAEPGTLAKVLERGYALDGGYSMFRGKAHGAPYGALPRDRLVAYVQSHDQIGNRAAGDRLHQLAGLDRARIAAALLFVSPFVPMLFQGEEWAASSPFCYFCDLQSPELRRAVREGRCAEHAAAGWASPPIDPVDPATRELSVLRWEERGEGAHAEMLVWYRRLAALRREHAALRDPSPASSHVRQRGSVLEVERGPLVLACNLGEEPVRLEGGEVLAASIGMASARELPPRSCALMQRA